MGFRTVSSWPPGHSFAHEGDECTCHGPTPGWQGRFPGGSISSGVCSGQSGQMSSKRVSPRQEGGYHGRARHSFIFFTCPFLPGRALPPRPGTIQLLMPLLFLPGCPYHTRGSCPLCLSHSPTTFFSHPLKPSIYAASSRKLPRLVLVWWHPAKQSSILCHPPLTWLMQSHL